MNICLHLVGFHRVWLQRFIKAAGPSGSLIISSVAGISAPSFMAILIVHIFGRVLQDYTGLNFTGSMYEIDEVTGEKYLARKEPYFTCHHFGIWPTAIITQLTRSAMLDVLGQDYIRTAYAKKCMTKKTVVLKHALPNALNPGNYRWKLGRFAKLLAGFFHRIYFGMEGHW